MLPLYSKGSTAKLAFGIVVAALFIWLEFRYITEISAPFYRGKISLQRLYRGISALNLTIIDGSDHQFVKFQLNILPLLLYFLIGISGTRKIWEYISGISRLRTHVGEYDTAYRPKRNHQNPFVSGNICKRKIVLRYCIFYTLHGIGFICYIHWATVIYFLFVLMIFYVISLLRSSKLNPLLTWCFAIFIMFSCDYYQGFRLFEWVFGSEHWIAEFVDKFRGDLPWHVYYRMSMLRVISFNFDRYWAYNNAPVYKTEDSYTNRVVQHLPEEYFGILEFFSYVLYPPLYIAGPIITFNCFITQLATPVISNTISYRVKHFIWMFSLTAFLTILMHYNCLHAISVSFVWESWKEAIPIGLVGFWTLQFMYFKFLTFWRFFRVFALCDNIVAPENMTRCMHNSHTFAEFWRSWHASFNKWTVRYLYIPLGGKNTQKYSIWLIFLFIGMWHDLWWSWIAWALMNCLFFSIELSILSEWKKSKYDEIRAMPGWFIISHIIEAWNSTFILCSNLAIVYGFDHMPTFIRLVFFGPGAWKVYLSITFFFGFFCMLQSEIRRREITACPISLGNKLSIQ